MFREVDTDGNDSIDKDEFLEMMGGTVKEEDSEEELILAFKGILSLYYLSAINILNRKVGNALFCTMDTLGNAIPENFSGNPGLNTPYSSPQ